MLHLQDLACAKDAWGRTIHAVLGGRGIERHVASKPDLDLKLRYGQSWVQVYSPAFDYATLSQVTRYPTFYAVDVYLLLHKI